MTLKSSLDGQVGERIWVKCEVKPGPFPDERMVLVDAIDGPWVGFVKLSSLQDPVDHGETAVVGVVVGIGGESLTVRLPGDPIEGRVRTLARGGGV